MAPLWYYTCEGKQMDPVSIQVLKQLASDGTLKPTDMVWNEGMPRWIRASSLKELYPDPTSAFDSFFTNAKATSAAAARTENPPFVSKPISEPTVPAKPLPTPEDDAPQPRSRKRRASRDAAEDDRPVPRRRTNTGSGSNLGIIIAFAFGGFVVLFALVVGVIILIADAPHPANPPAAQTLPLLDNRPPIRVKAMTVDTAVIPKKQSYHRLFSFRKDIIYKITVTSEPRQPDVDLYIYDRNSNVQALDNTPGPDSLIEKWSPSEDGDYRIELRNLDLFLGVTSTITIREIGEQPLPTDVKIGNGIIKGMTLAPDQDKVFKLRVKAEKPASVTVISHTKRPDVDFNVYILKEDGTAVIASDVTPGANARVEFRRDADETVRVRVHNASKTAIANCTITFDGGS